jgi:hypothetical protein
MRPIETAFTLLLTCRMEISEQELVLYYRNMENEPLLEVARTRNELSEKAQEVLERELASRHLLMPALTDQIAPEEMPDEKIITLRTFVDFSEAMAARAALEAAGIPCFLRDENFLRNAWHLSGFAGYSRLDIREHDRETAEQALAPVDTAEAESSFQEDPEFPVDTDGD